MSPQQQAEAILAKADTTDELVLRLAQDREALLTALHRMGETQVLPMFAIRAIAQAEATK